MRAAARALPRWFGLAQNQAAPSVNLILFESSELGRPLPHRDRRATHILDVLRRQPGEAFDAGLINGPRGKATLTAVSDEGLTLDFSWTEPPRPPEPVTLIIGLPRPQTARDVLRDATTLGVATIEFVRTEKSDPGYGQSTLWASGEWRRQLIAGAAQAFDTRIPDVTFTDNLSDAVARLPSPSVRIALDVYEAQNLLGESSFSREAHCVLAIGGERGWSAADREVLRAQQFTFAHLGTRVLRTETATVAALAILRTKLGLM